MCAKFHSPKLTTELTLLCQVLKKIRGQEDVEMEFQDIVMQTREANAVKNPMGALLKPCYRPQLVISIVISIVQQLTGINAIMFYAPQVFSTFGSGRKSSLLSTVIIGAGAASTNSYSDAAISFVDDLQNSQIVSTLHKLIDVEQSAHFLEHNILADILLLTLI